MSEKQNTPLTFMAVHAHPDDEVFSGGIFPYLADRNIRTVLVTSTLGEEGEIVDPALDEQARKEMFPRLGEVRKQELQAAIAALRIDESRLLGYRDSGMAGRESNNHPESFHRAFFDEAVKRVVALIREFRPQVMLTYDAFGSYGHPDHIQAHRVTNAAFEAAGEPRCFPELGLEAWQPSKLYYAVMSRSMFGRFVEESKAAGLKGWWDDPDFNINTVGSPDEQIYARLDVRPYVDLKLQAAQAHKTQIAPDDFFLTLTPEQRELAFGYEHFILGRSAIVGRGDNLETDLFAGLL